MIEKVWKLTEKGIKDYNGKVGSLEEVVQVLNNYHFKQNQDLKNRNNLQSEIQNLKKENEQLKSNLKHELTVSKSLRDIVKEQDKENKELKKRLSDLQKENYGNIDGIAFYQEENAMLKNTIARNEAYIERMQHKGEWRK